MQMMQKLLTDVMQTYTMIDPKFVIWSLSIKKNHVYVCINKCIYKHINNYIIFLISLVYLI